MIIDQLPEISSVQTTDELPIERGTTTYKTPVSKLGSGVVSTVLSEISSNATPLMDGTAAVGTSTKLARQDHVHPHDSLIVRKNLLDNWYFVGGNTTNAYGVFPINQRSQGSYTNSGYTVDRWWKSADTTVTVNSGYITYSNPSSGNKDFDQVLDGAYNGWIGRKLTGSVLLSSGELVYGTLTVPSNAPANDTGYYPFCDEQHNIMPRIKVINASVVRFCIRVAKNKSANIVAAKLELGDTQTLCHDVGGSKVLNEIPDYGEQLRRCQRYLWRLNVGSANMGLGIAYGAGSNASYMVLPNPVPMVDVAASNISIVYSSVGAFVLTQTTVADGFTSTGIANSGSCSLFTSFQISSSGNLSAGTSYRCVLKTGEYILVSRET